MTAPIGTYWTPGKIADLKRLADGTNSADAIAVALGGITRNAVIGKVRREGLRLSASVGCIRSRAVNPLRSRALPQRRVKLALPSPQVEPAPSPFKPKLIKFEKIRNGLCKYPYGESPPFRFCGCKSVHGLSWCPEHLRIVTGKAFEGHPQAAGVRKGASR